MAVQRGRSLDRYDEERGAVVFYTLCISVFNLALGFGLALYLRSLGISLEWQPREFFSQMKLTRFGRARHSSTDRPPANPPASHAASIFPTSPENRAAVETEAVGESESAGGLSTK